MPDHEPTTTAAAAVVTPHAILLAARDAIADPGRWVQNHYALGPNLESIPPESPDAVSRCMLGALMYAQHHCRAAAGLPPVRAFSDRAFGWAETYLALACETDPGEYNDAPDRTHDEIMCAFDEAIDNAGFYTHGITETADPFFAGSKPYG